MKKLAPVHSGLRRLRRFRSMVRLGSAWSVAISVVLWALAVAFLLDFWIRMGRLERGVLLLAVVGTAAWALMRYLLPALRVREDDVALALLVERQQALNSDLVAALQFAEAGRAQYGSGALREAVVDYTGEAAAGLNFLEGFSREQLLRRAGLLCVSAALIVLPAVAFPAHVRAFLSRLLLGTAHYPTRTRIERIVSPTGLYAAYGQPVEFKVRAAGVLPAGGQVRLRALASELTTTIELTAQPDDPNLYVGSLSRVLDDLSYTVHLGDAYTEPRDLKLIPLPLVELALEVTPPDYAAARFKAGSEQRRQTVAPEGSSVSVVVTADKKLASGTATIDGNSYAMKPGAGGLVLPAAGTPLVNVTEPVRFQVQVVDGDGLSLERPISGMVQVTPDRPPRIAAGAVSKYVLPTAVPEIRWGAADDYGLAKVLLHQTISRPGQDKKESTVELAIPAGHPAEFTQSHQVALAPLELVKGDQVTIVLEAVDYRGQTPGRPGKSDPIVFLVTDREGVLEAMKKLDDRMVEKLDQIIRAQLGIGE